MKSVTDEPQEGLETVLQHIGALRTTLMHCMLIILGGFLLVFPFSDVFLKVLNKPLQNNSHTSIFSLRQEKIKNSSSTTLQWKPSTESAQVIYSSEGVQRQSETLFQIPPQGYLIYERWVPKHQLLILNPIEGFLVSLKLSLWLGLFLSSPFWIAKLLQFLLPALTTSEKKILLPLVLASYTAITIGFLATYYGTLPAANAYFFAFNENLGENLWSLSSYVQFSLWLLCANIVSCEYAAVGFLLVHTRWISSRQLQGKRKWAILGAFILGALLTPPDILTQFLVAVPLIIFYELILIYAKWLDTYHLLKNSIKA